MRVPSAFAIFLVACGSSAPASTLPSNEPSSQDEPAVAEPVTDVEPVEVTEASPDLACAQDADCVVGGPGRCCASSGSACVRAWSRTAWDAVRAECDAQQCDRVVMLTCADGPTGEVDAVCVQGGCQLRPR